MNRFAVIIKKRSKASLHYVCYNFFEKLIADHESTLNRKNAMLDLVVSQTCASICEYAVSE